MGMPRGMREAITADRLDRIKEKNRQKDDASKAAMREGAKSSSGGDKNDHARRAGKEYSGNRDGGRK